MPDVRRFTALLVLGAAVFAAGLYLAASVNARGSTAPAPGVALNSAVGRARGPAPVDAPVPRRPSAFRALASNSAVYSDPAGDNVGASPDITTVTVSNDDSGNVTMSIALPNRATLDSDMYIDTYFDSDQNSGTGLTGGADYLLRAVGSESKIYLYSCSATVCNTAVAAPSLSASYGSGLTVHISSADLHASTGFSFYIYTYSCSSTCVQDTAGEWNYQFTVASTTSTGSTSTGATTTRPSSTTAPTTTAGTTTGATTTAPTTTTTKRPSPPPPPAPGSLGSGPPPPGLSNQGGPGAPPTTPTSTQSATTTVTAQSTPNAPAASKTTLAVTVLTVTPKVPRHGRLFTVRLSIARSDTGLAVTTGTVTCAARIGTRRVSATVHAMVGGRATCAWKMPSGSRGKRLVASASFAYGSLRVSRAFTIRIT